MELGKGNIKILFNADTWDKNTLSTCSFSINYFHIKFYI